MDKKSAFEIFEQNLGNVLREGNKLTVVFACLVIILIGIVIYLLYTEKKIKNLENQLKDKLK